MYDTIAALLSPVTVDESVFHGGVVSEEFDTGRQSVRLYLNPSGDYAPRVTYWRDGQVLKLEFSLSKMAGINPHQNMTQADAERALDLVDAFVSAHFPALPGVREWTCQRVDYAYMWDVGSDAAGYIAMLSDLRIGGMKRQTHESGVVFKAGNRWVKFYVREHMLRFEVSNYRRSVSYMCKRWFGCARTVRELVHPGRALYVLALYLEKLGVGDVVVRSAVIPRLRACYGASVASAYYALECITAFGSASYSTHKLISSSSYYSWKRRLSDDGFIVVVDDDSVVSVDERETLVLSMSFARENLKTFAGAGVLPSPSRIFPKFFANLIQV